MTRFNRKAISLNQQLEQTTCVEEKETYSQKAEFLWFKKTTIIDSSAINDWVSKQKSNRKIYGVKLYDSYGQKINLSQIQILFICFCYLFLNWQFVKPIELRQYLSQLPKQQNSIQKIRFESNKVKFDIGNKSLCYNTLNSKFQQQNLTYESNSLLNYTKSIKKLTFNGVTYHFNSPILEVESNATLISVRTSNEIKIITPTLRYKLQVSASAMKWTSCQLYVLGTDGDIYVMKRQNIFRSKINQMSLEQDPIGSCNEGEIPVCVGKELLLVSTENNVLRIRVDDNVLYQQQIKLETTQELNKTGLFAQGNNLIVIFVIKKGRHYSLREITFGVK